MLLRARQHDIAFVCVCVLSCVVLCCASQEGDTIDVKGPFGKFSYEGSGNYTLNRWVGSPLGCTGGRAVPLC